MAVIKLLPPFHVEIAWTDSTDETMVRRYFNKRVSSTMVHVSPPEGLGELTHVKVSGKCGGVDISELAPSVVSDFGDLGEGYKFCRIGNPNLIDVPAALPETFESLELALANSTQLDSRKIERWNTGRIRRFKRAFDGCTRLMRNLTCWDASGVESTEQSDIGDAAIPDKRKPLWGRSSDDSTGRTGLPCTPINLRVVGTETTVTNEAAVFRADAQADIDDAPLNWQLNTVDQTDIQSFQINDRALAITSDRPTRAILRAEYDDGEYSAIATREVNIIDNILIDAPPTISSLGCGSLIFITANLTGDVENYTLQWTQVSGPEVEIDNPNSLTMGFVRPRPGTFTQYEEYVFKLTVGQGTAVARELEVRVSSIPITSIRSDLNHFDLISTAKAQRFTPSSNIRIEHEPRVGSGGTLFITTPNDARWNRVEVYALTEGAWFIHNNSTTRNSNIQLPVGDGIYAVVDVYSDSVRVSSEQSYRHPNVYSLGYRDGIKLEYIDRYPRFPSKVLYVSSVVSSIKQKTFSSNISSQKTFSDYRRLVFTTGHDIRLNSLALLPESTLGVVDRLDVAETMPQSELAKIELVSVSVSNSKLTRFDVRYVEG